MEERRPRSAVIWGTGYIGLEMAENFSKKGLSVTLINRSERVMRTLVSEVKARLLRELEDHDRTGCKHTEPGSCFYFAVKSFAYDDTNATCRDLFSICYN